MPDSFWGSIFKSKTKDKGITGILKEIPIFEELNRKQLAAIKRILHRREYRQDEVIFYQGEAGIGMYIIESGTVSIEYEPTHQVIAELPEGEFFGEMALLIESPRSATAKAKTPCKLLFFSHSELFDLMGREIKCGIKIISRLAEILAERLRLANEQCQALQEELKALRTETDQE